MKRLTAWTPLALFLLGALAPEAGVAQTADWYDPSWDHRIYFEAIPDSIDGSGPFSEFMLVLDLSAPGFAPVFASADSQGADLVVTSGDGTSILPMEIVSYDPDLETGEVWFRASTLSDLDNGFYLYYAHTTGGASQVTANGGSSAWGAEHLAVYHFSEDPSLGQLRDWGPSGNDAVAAVAPAPSGPGWQSSDQVPGAVGTGWEFDGEELWCYAPSIAATDSSYTISAWFANNPVIDGGAVAFQADEVLFDLSFQVTQGSPLTDARTPTGQITWWPQHDAEQLHHYVWTLDAEADTVRFFLDGEEIPIWTRYETPGGNGVIYQGLDIGSQVGIASPYDFNSLDLSDGVVDEYRIIQAVRGPEWIRTEFRNQNDPAGFFAVFAEQSYSGGPVGIGDSAGLSPFNSVRVWPNPISGRAWVDVETGATELTVRVFDARGRLVRTLPRPSRESDALMRYFWDGNDEAGTRVSNGIYFFRVRSGASTLSTKAIMIR